MTPAVTDGVLVFTDPRCNNGADVAPAVVTRVWPDGLVNVRVLHDGPSAGPEGRVDWVTSVPLFGSREAAEAAHQEAWGHVDHPVPPFAAFRTGRRRRS